MAFGCKSKQPAGTDSKAETPSREIVLEYEAMTRGHYRKVVITKTETVTAESREAGGELKMATAAADWKTLLGLVDGIDLAKVETLRAPSNKNHVDAALAATLKITKGNKVYQSTVFDHGNPPAQLKALIEKMIAIAKFSDKKRRNDN